MSHGLVVRPLAEQDLLEAQEWYELQRPGLGGEFRGAIDDLLERVADHPRLYPPVYRGLRRAVVRRFPYLVFFAVGPQVVTIVACLHGRRRPGLVRSRVP